jgi:hypothetical protein
MRDDLNRLEDEIFRRPPKQFTAARDALVAALKAAGRNDDAKAAKAWRRPTVPVWLWNRLILDGEDSARQALDAAVALGEGIEAGRRDLGAEIASLREAASPLLARARQLAADLRVGLAQERELVELVQALPWSQSAREAAARGRLLEAPPPVDPLEVMRIAGGAPRTQKVEPAKAEAAKAQAALAKAALAKAEAALAERQAALAERQAARATARRAVERAEKALAEAQERAQAADADEDAAQRWVDEARRALDDVES